MEADDDGSTATIMHRWRWKKLRCDGSIYGMREGDEREKVFKI